MSAVWFACRRLYDLLAFLQINIDARCRVPSVKRVNPILKRPGRSPTGRSLALQRILVRFGKKKKTHTRIMLIPSVQNSKSIH